MAPKTRGTRKRKIIATPSPSPSSASASSSSHETRTKHLEDRPAPVPPPPPPPVLDRFRSNRAQEIYERVLLQESFGHSMTFNWTAINQSRMSELFTQFNDMGLTDFLGCQDLVYKDLVREFYANMDFIAIDTQLGIQMRSRVGGVDFVFSESDIARIFNLRHRGVRLIYSAEDVNVRSAVINFDHSDFDSAQADLLLRNEFAVPQVLNEATITANGLKGKWRILHYAVNRNIFPKKASNNQITFMDKEIFWHLHHRREINWPYVIMCIIHMKTEAYLHKLVSTRDRHVPMAYPVQLTRLFRDKGVPLDDFESMEMPVNWIFGKMNLNAMHMVKTRNRGWIFNAHFQHGVDVRVHTDAVVPPPGQAPPAPHDRVDEEPPAPAQVPPPPAQGQGFQVTEAEWNSMRADLTSMRADMTSLTQMVKDIWDRLGCASGTAPPPALPAPPSPDDTA